ncbi:MAG: HAD family hydrolase [Ignavibacteria bacterium]|nr:MAG: HAD family hydrolase [Ignavibacteria bacterium]
MPNKAIFLDRDDTLNYDPGYLNDPDKVKLYPGVGEGIAKLKKEYGFKAIVISNQSGVTRGLISLEQVEAVNNRINALLKDYGTEIDDFYFCPYHPDFDDEEKTSCRKPSPKMVLEAAKKYNIDLSASYFIGDQFSDVECGNNAGCKTILITNKISPSEINDLQSPQKTPNFVACDFLNACDFIIKDLKET